MADRTDVKALVLEVDASIELLRAKLRQGEGVVDRFAGSADASLSRIDRRFAELGRPTTGFAQHLRTTATRFSAIGDAAEVQEIRVRRSAEGMKTALLASAGTIAAAFSAQSLARFADSYTGFTNSLKVADLEGQRLASTQDALYLTAQRYGVQLGLLGDLYGGIAGLQRDLNATDADTLKLTQATAAAIKIKGGSAESAAGAIIGLNQALAQQRVQSDEYNQILDGARPLLQAAAAASDKYAGSLARLKQDIEAGNVSGNDLFRLLLAGYDRLEAKAGKAQLTIAASFTVLDNALARYVGEADAGAGATSQISAAIVALADNLDLIVPALAVIGAGFAGKFASGPILAAVAAVSQLKTELSSQTVVLLGSKTAIAQRAEFLARSAATEVASIQSRVAALREEARQMAVNYGLARKSGDPYAQQTARADLSRVLRQLGAEEDSLAAAKTRSTAATKIATEATKAATLAARAGAVAARLFSGALALVGGPAGLAAIAIGALITRILTYQDTTRNAAADQRLLDDNTKKLNETLARLASTGQSAAGGIAAAGNAAQTSTGQMLSFAGAVGEAARQLQVLAQRRRDEKREELTQAYAAAQRDEANALARISARDARLNAGGRNAAAPTMTQADRDGLAADRAALAQAQANRASAARAWAQVRRSPLESELTQIDRDNGRDVAGELARTNRDLTIARERGKRAQINDLEAQRFELTQFQKYRRTGLSAEAALSQAQRDAAEFRSASGEREAGRVAAASTRERATAARQEAAAVRDAASDARAYAAAERQAGNDIAAARAELTNSAVERAAIEKARIEAERDNRDQEIASQGPDGLKRFTAAQVAALQDLNRQRAELEAQAVDLAERRRIDAEALDVSQAALGDQRDLLESQARLARTSEERRAVALRILDIQYQEEEARLRAVTVANGATEAEARIAEARLRILDQLKAEDRETVRQDTAGPLERYLDEMPRNAAEAAEQVEAIAVDKLRDLNDEIADVVLGAKSIEDAFADMARSIIRDLIKIAVQQAIIRPMAESLFGGTQGGGGSGSLFGSIGSLLSMGGDRFGQGGTGLILTAAGGKRRAGGGSVYAGEGVLVGEHGPERVRFRQSARVIPHTGLRSPGVSRRETAGAGGRDRAEVRIVPSRYFDAVVDARARAVALPMAEEAAQQGAQAGFTATMDALGRPTL